MKTFTTYAEKKAKQFLNLLQGYTKGIRITAILILLLMGVSNAWAFNQSNVDLYFDNSTSQWTDCYVYIGKGDYTSCYSMVRVSGTQYLWRLEQGQWNWGNSWDGASGWVVSKEKWWDSNGEDIYKFVYHGNKNVTNIRTSAWNATTIYKADGTQSVTHYNTACTVYKWSTSTKSDYTVTINSPTGGTLTVKDYDNNTVSSGASKIKLTVLKFSASASTGYTFGGVQINNGSTTTTIDAADIDSETYTLTSNVTITPIWTEKTYSVTISAGNGGTVSPSGSQTVGQVTAKTVTATPNANYEFVNWTSTGGVVIANASSATTTITATATGTLTANFRSTVTNSLTVVAGTGIASVTGSTDPVTLGNSYAITATPKTGYSFSTWTANPAANATFGSATTANTTVTVNNGSVTVTASATENTHDVTVSYKYGSTTIKDNTTTTAVGEANAKSITAPSITGYTFKEWTLGDGITNKSANTTTNPISITTKESGNYTLTANYDVIPCNFLYGSTTPLNNPTDGGKMSYDPNEKAYYIDVTTNSKPYYFQFYYNNSTKWAGNWNGGFPYVYEVTANGDKVDCNQNVAGWENKASLRFEGISGSAIRVWFDYENKKAWITEKTYSVTISAADNGSVTPSGTQQVGASGLSVTATANTGYKFKNWTVTDGAQVTDANSATTTVTATAEGTITANFEEDLSTGWYLAGEFSNNGDDDTGWETNKIEFQKISGQSTGTVSYITMDLLPTTFTDDYKMSFKIVNDGNWYGNNGTYKKANNKQQWQFETSTGNCYLEVSLPGTYTFRLQSDSTDSKKYISIVYPIVNQLQVYTANPAHNAAIANWDWDSQNGDIYTKTLSLNANTDYTFKAVINSAFYGQATTLTRVSSSANLNTSGGNVTLSTDIAGDYIFTFNASNNQLAITYPEYTIVPIYLNLSDFTDWEKDNASFKIKYDNITTTFTQIGCSHYYTCEAPQEKNITIFRTDGASEWNPISTIVPTNANNCFKVTGWNTGSWSTYTEPTHDITINAPESGTITVTINGNTTTVTNEATTIEDVALNAQMTVNYIPNNGYIVGKSHIIIGTNDTISTTTSNTYTVCGPTEITAYFVTEEDQVVYLRPTDAWLADNALFYAYAFNRYGDNEWIELVTKETDYTGAYGCTIPAGYSDVIFVRLNPNGTDNSNNKLNFHNAWNQSVDYVIPVNTTTNRFIIGEKVTSGSDKDKYQGSWEASDTPIWSIPGDWTGDKQWTAENATPLYGPNGNATLALQASITTEFKLYQFPYGTQERQWYGNSETLVRGNSADKEFTTGTDNCKLTTDIAGDYVFSFNIRNKRLTVTYPELPVPNAITVASRRLYDNTELDWFEGNGTEANPYKLYNDETIRLTVSPLTEVAGLTAYYKMGDNEEQTSNVFDWEETMSEPTKTTIQAYYKNATGTSTETVSVETPYYIQISLPFYLMTEPSGEININRVAAGENILVQFRSDAAATVGLYVKIGNGEEQKLTDITSTISTDYTHDVDNNIDPCVLHYIARSTATVHDRIFEATTDVAIYKNVIIKVNDPEGWVKNAYMWRDGSGDVLTPWPGDPVLQHFGTWRVFSVKYPYYDRFIVNAGAEGTQQTIDWILPSYDRCYELLDPKNNGSDLPEDVGKYGLKEAECPGNLIVGDLQDTTICVSDQIVVIPSIALGLGYSTSNLTPSVTSSNTTAVTATMSGMNITIIGNAEGESTITVTYTLVTGETATKTFKVTVEKNTNITIQVKVLVDLDPDRDDMEWVNENSIYIRYWGNGINHTNLNMTYLYNDGTYKYAQARIPLDNNEEINFFFYYENYDIENENWRQTNWIQNVRTRGCYEVLKDGEYYNRGWRRDGDNCANSYQVKILMANGKTYTSNTVSDNSETLSFFAPGMNETGYKAGAVMLYHNNKMIATIAPDMFNSSNVYVANLNANFDNITNVAPYTGDFYIRTWGTNGDIDNKGWHSVKDWNDTQKKSRTFTEFVSREGEFYNHYWVQAMNTGGYEGKDVSACVANEYNDDLAGKLLQDKHTNEYGDIKVGTDKVINVRFGYDPRTNYFGRAILQGSQFDTYLNIHCDNAYRDKDCTPSKKFPYGTSTRDNKMYDISTWVYQRDIYVPIDNSHPSASLYLEATSPSTERDVTDHLLGYVINEITGEATSTPIQKTVIGSGTTNGTYLIRVIYDFKTNRIITAWLPQGTVEVNSEKTLNADVLFVRKENEEVPQIQLSSTGKIKSLESMFFAMELQRGDADRNNRHQEQYWFTLPFDCVVGSISGVPGYMQIWGIQRYNGKKRAENGWFNPSTTFWEWLTPDDVMHAGEGYLLVFDKKNAPFEEIEVDKMDAEGNIIDGQKEIISMMRLYFPSIKSGFDMQQQSEEQLKRTYENHTCTITTANRYLQDSNWKVIGTTSYNNAGITGYTRDDNPKYDELSEAPSFRYKYEYTMSNDNTSFWYRYTPENGQTATYKSFYGYMVQFAGTINWQPIMSETVPEQIAARRYVPANERTSYTTRLELANAAGEVQDLTFVALDEKATTGFDQNKDLNKVKNRGTNIYTFVEGLPFAGNTLPMEKATVPVGVRVDAAGEYTFRMPDGTDGIAVTLVDNVTGTHTNMLMNEYTVTLNAGTIENRFYLVVDPDRTATSVENVGSGANGDEAKGVEKFLIDGKLFIRTTDGIFDAKGQRL